jgi:hypothetical protein
MEIHRTDASALMLEYLKISQLNPHGTTRGLHVVGTPTYTQMAGGK